ncbi:MAG: hypothetical protein ACRCYZ_03260 [Alphaproteobacteria bacterium]
MKYKFLAFTLLLSTSFQVMANDDEAPYRRRQYVVKSIKFAQKIKDRLPVLTNGTEVISKIQVQAIGSTFDGGVFAKDTVVEYYGSKKIKSSNSRTLWNVFHGHHLPVGTSYDLRRPKDGETIDVNDSDGNLTLFVLKQCLELMPEGEDKDRITFFYRFLEALLNLATPKTLEKFVFYPDISEKTVEAVRISGSAIFINNQPLAGLSPDDFSRVVLDSPVHPRLLTFISYSNDELDHRGSFLEASPLKISLNESVSNLLLKELKGGNVSLTANEIHVTKSTPFMLETEEILDCKTERFFGQLKKSIKNSKAGDFLVYHATYTIPGLSVSMGPILNENLEKTSELVPDSWGLHARKKALYHFDKLFLDKLNELTGKQVN